MTVTASAGALWIAAAFDPDEKTYQQRAARAAATHDPRYPPLTRRDLADFATDDLVELTGLSEERAKALIMSARAPWFAEEQG